MVNKGSGISPWFLSVTELGEMGKRERALGTVGEYVIYKELSLTMKAARMFWRPDGRA